MKGKVLLLSAQDTINHPRFNADAERYSDSALAALGDTYMLSREEISGYIPYFTKMLAVQRMLYGSGARAILRTMRRS